MNALPMTLGSRWLIPATMTLLLVRAPMHRLASPATLATLMFASLAGFDTLALTMLPWGYCLLLETIRLRSPSHLFYRIASAIAAIAVAQVILAAVIYLSTGALLDYRPYLNLIFQFRPSEDSFWSVPFVPHYALWFPVGLAFFLIMASGFYRALRGDAVLTLAAAVLAAITLTALVLDSALSWWWADSVAALVIAVALAVEGIRVAVHRRYF